MVRHPRHHERSGRPARPAGSRWLAVASAAGLHAALLALWSGPGLAGHPQGVAMTTRAPALSVRWVVAPSPPPFSSERAMVSAATTPSPPAPLPRGERGETPQPAPFAVLESLPPADRQEPQPADAAALGNQGFEDYLPRSALTLAPSPSAEIFMPYPDGAPLGHFEAVLTLFIDELGQVRHVRVEQDSLLPAVLLDTARQAFLAGRYTPGELDSRPVKSRIAIAVEFRGEAPTRPVGE